MQNRGIEHLKSIIEYCQDVMNFMKKINYDKNVFFESKMEQYGISFCIEQIGELVNKLSEEGYEKKYPELPWRKIYGMRNHIAHGYGAIDLQLVYDTGVKDVPVLLEQCKEIHEKETGLIYRIQNAEQRAGTVQNNAPAKDKGR